MQCFTCTKTDKIRTIIDVFLCQNKNIHRNMLLEGFPGRAGLPLISQCPPFPVTHGTGTTPLREELCLPEEYHWHWFPPWIIRFKVLSKIYFSGLWQYTVTPSPVSRVSGWEKDFISAENPKRDPGPWLKSGRKKQPGERSKRITSG